MLYQLDAEAAHRGVFLHTIAVRDQDRHRQPGLLAGQAQALAVITTGRTDQSGRPIA